MEEQINECPKCKSENIEFVDDSFDHDWNGGGVEVIKYHKCEDCDWEED